MTESPWANWAAEFDRAYAALSPSTVKQQVWRAVFGDEYPAEADPDSFTTRSELARIAQELRVGPGQTFADIGCGRGGVSLWVARATGAALVGIDIAPTALHYAAEQVAAMGLADRARFQEGEFAATGLPAASLDGVMSVDVLVFVVDKAAAVREMARVLRPGGRFVFTSLDCNGPLRERPPQVGDHRPLLEGAGFVVESYDETPDWRQRQRAILEGMRAARGRIAAEAGAEAVERLLREAEIQLANLDQIQRRVLVVARRQCPSHIVHPPPS